MFEQELIKKLDDRSALIGVIGLGYVPENFRFRWLRTT